MATAFWLQHLEGPTLTVLASYALALVIPCTAVYALAVFGNDRRPRAPEGEEGSRGTTLKDRLVQLAHLEGTIHPRASTEEDRAEEAGNEEASGMDPWMHAFSGCLREREILDRKPLPGASSSGETDESREDED